MYIIYTFDKLFTKIFTNNCIETRFGRKHFMMSLVTVVIVYILTLTSVFH